MLATTIRPSRPNVPIEGLRAIVEAHQLGRVDDLPVITVSEIDFRLGAIAMQDATAELAAMLRRIGIRRDPCWVAHMVMMAALKAMHDNRVRTEYREPALADVRAQITLLDRAARVLADLAEVQDTRGRQASAVAQSLTPHPASEPLRARDLVREIEQDRQRLLDEAAALDGRCRPTSRARLFVDALAPLYAELTEGRHTHRTGFTDFVRHSCLLVTDQMPSETLIRSVVTKRSK